jgi:hypothetical protein
MSEEHENACTTTSKSHQSDSQIAVGVEKPWAEMTIEERDAADRKRGFNNEGDRIGGEGVVVGVDPAVDVDSSTILMFRLTKDDKKILHCLMVKNDHLSYVDTLTKLLREEAARIGELSCPCSTTNATTTPSPKSSNTRSLWQMLRRCLGARSVTNGIK